MSEDRRVFSQSASRASRVAHRTMIGESAMVNTIESRSTATPAADCSFITRSTSLSGNFCESPDKTLNSTPERAGSSSDPDLGRAKCHFGSNCTLAQEQDRVTARRWQSWGTRKEPDQAREFVL